MKIIIVLTLLLPLSLICMSKDERRELHFDWLYLTSVNSELIFKQQCLIWTGGAGVGYALIKSAQAKRRAALAGLSATALSGVAFTYLEHELQKNNQEREQVKKRFQQLTKI